LLVFNVDKTKNVLHDSPALILLTESNKHLYWGEGKEMLRIKHIGIMAIVTTALWVLSGCAGGHVEMEEVGTTVNPAEEVNRFDSEISNARKNQLNVLAPTSFAKAEAYLDDAKKALKSGDEFSEILEPIGPGRAQLKNAEEMAQVARTTLPDAIKARELARAAGATNLGEDYARAEEQFLKLTKAIEDNDLK